MTWLHTLNYFGPDRRAKRQMRIIERRGPAAVGDIAALREALRANGLQGALWIDHPSYFGLDRRSGNFSHYILERRRDNCAGAPPRLAGALRQLRVRVLEAEDPRTRGKFFERLRATALLADAQNYSSIGDLLLAVADRPSRSDVAAQLQAALLRAEDMLACGQ
jgi:ribosomal protein S28E/S33